MGVIAELAIAITAKVDGLTKGLSTGTSQINTFTKKVEDMGKKMTSVGKQLTMNLTVPLLALGTGAVKIAVDLGKAAEQLNVLSEVTGFSRKSLQEWRYVADQVGISTDTVTTAISGLTRRLPQLEQEVGAGSDALQRIGLTFDDLRSLKPEAIFDLLIQKLGEMPNLMDRNAASSKIFGQAWGDIAPLLAISADELARLRDEAQDTIMTDEQIDSAAAFGNTWEKVTAKLTAAKNAIALALMPILEATLIPFIINKVIPWLQAMAVKIEEAKIWWDGLSKSTQNWIAVAAGITVGAGPTLVFLGNMAKGFGSIGTALTFLSAHPVVAGLSVISLLIGLNADGQLAAKTYDAIAAALRSVGEGLGIVSDNTYNQVETSQQLQRELEAVAFDAQILIQRFQNWGELSGKTIDEVIAAMEQFGITAQQQIEEGMDPNAAIKGWKDAMAGMLASLGTVSPAAQKEFDAIVLIGARALGEYAATVTTVAEETAAALATTTEEAAAAVTAPVEFVSLKLKEITDGITATMAEMAKAGEGTVEYANGMATLEQAYATLLDYQDRGVLGLDEWLKKLKDAGAGAIRTIPLLKQLRDAFGDFATSLVSGVSDALTEAMIAIADYGKDSAEALTEHTENLADINASADETQADMVLNRDRDLTQAQLDHQRDETDLETQHAAELAALAQQEFADAGARQTAYAAAEKAYQDSKLKLDTDFQRKITDAETAFTNQMTDLATDRQKALDDEKTAYEEQKKSLWQILGDIAKAFVTSVRNELFALAAKLAVLGAVDAVLGLFGNVVAGARAVGELIAAGIAFAGATALTVVGFAKGGIALGPTMGLVGEAGVPEAVVPLTNENLAAIGAGVRGNMALAGGGSIEVNFWYPTVRSDDDLNQIVLGIQNVLTSRERGDGMVRVRR